MNAFLPGLLSFVIVVVAPAQAAAPTVPAARTPASASSTATAAASPTSAAPVVNPLTGQPLAFEAAQRRLEQMRLETQLLEEEAKQAAIRNNLSLAPIRRGNEERRLQSEMFGPMGAAGAAGAAGAVLPAIGGPVGATGGVPAARAIQRPARAAAPIPPTVPATVPVALPSVPSAAIAQGPQVLAILRNGDQRRAIVQSGGASASVSEGDEWMGRRIGAITDGSVTIDGATVELPRNPAVIVASDRRPPPGQSAFVQQPGAQLPTAGPTRMPATSPPSAMAAQPFPPLPPLPSVPVIGPVDPRNPLSALGPQPVGFPPMPPRPVSMPTVPAGDLPR
jgi:hypothetical protein